jgi:hypothetical protein
MTSYGKRLTIWLGDDDGSAEGVEVTREDNSVLISCPGSDQDLEIFIPPALFPAIRAAMDATERR